MLEIFSGSSNLRANLFETCTGDKVGGARDKPPDPELETEYTKIDEDLGGWADALKILVRY
jgi:hypothetical protein